MKKKVETFEYANQILSALKSGLLLTTKSNEKVNTMAIGWGMLGIEWKKPIFITYVRENRYTKSQLDKVKEFTISVPIGTLSEREKKIISTCGTESGRNVDKVKRLNLTLEQPDVISVPAIKEFPLTLECKVIYARKQDSTLIPEEIRKSCYPQHVPSDYPMANKDFHIEYYGEVVSAYIIE